jgi:hypothetical protein
LVHHQRVEVTQKPGGTTPVVFEGIPRYPVNGAVLTLMNGGDHLAVHNPNRNKMAGTRTDFTAVGGSTFDFGFEDWANLTPPERAVTLLLTQQDPATGSRLDVDFRFEPGRDGNVAFTIRRPGAAPIVVEYLSAGAVVGSATVRPTRSGSLQGAFVLGRFGSGAQPDGGLRYVDDWAVINFTLNFAGAIPFTTVESGQPTRSIDAIRINDAALPPWPIVRSIFVTMSDHVISSWL